VVWIIAILAVFLVSFSYLQTELTTSYFIDKIGDWHAFCQEKENPDLKGIKILSYEKYKGQATIYCLYSDNSKNSRLLLNSVKGEWSVVFQKKLNADSEFYWPVYF
jgi:hypothetical protein